MIVNGKDYPMWGQFVERKEEWIGGVLQELRDSFPRCDSGEEPSMVITDITLVPNGNDSAFFSVEGEAFNCGADVHYLGIGGGGESWKEGWITFSGYGGHAWRIKQRAKQ